MKHDGRAPAAGRQCLFLAMAGLVLALALPRAHAQPAEAGALAPGQITVSAPENDNGKHLQVAWKAAAAAPGSEGGNALLFRAPAASVADNAAASDLAVAIQVLRGALVPKAGQFGPWTLVAVTDTREGTLVDEVAPDTAYIYGVVTAQPAPDQALRIAALSQPIVSAPATPDIAYFHTERWFFLTVILLLGAALFVYHRRVKKDPGAVFIRRIPGVDALEEAIGRSTEMGRPVLYVTGSEDINNIQTIASLLILGKVAEMVADYDTELKVANYYPLTMVVAEEIVRQGFANAGRMDAHRPENVLFISAEQFAFAAGVNGLILRERPATNIYLGRFFAESLILAETGHLTKAIQIAGTAEITQLPFFIAACDYTILGEELYAVSAYLAREPVLLATLKASDFLKLLIMILILVGSLAATFGLFELGPVLIP